MKKRSWLLTIFVALLPTLLTLIILGGIFQVDIANFRPRVWHDQGGYWHWARSFSEYGFGVGYNGFDEAVAPAAFNHYAENGPFYQMIYGGIGQIVGWTGALPIYINMGLLAIALTGFMRVAKLENRQILHVGALVILLLPILLYLPSSMHETLNQAIAVLLASVFFLLYKEKKERNLAQKWVLIAFLIFASLIRLSWAILFFPLFFMLLGEDFIPRSKGFSPATAKAVTTKKLAFTLLFSAALGYLVLRISSYLLPPAGNIIFELIQNSLTEGMHVFLDHLRMQLDYLLTREKNQMDLVVTLQVLVLAMWNFFYLFSELKEKLKKPSLRGSFIAKIIPSTLSSLSFFNVYNLLVPLGMGLFFYLVNGYHRIFVPHILISALLLISQKKYLPVYAILLVGLLGSTPFLNKYQELPANFQPDSQAFLASRTQLEEHIVFNPDAENAWCNTVLIPAHEYHLYITMMPAGMGVAPIFSPSNLNYPLKSKYLLLDEDTLKRGAYIKHFPIENLKLELLDSLPRTDIYYNQASGCSLD